MFGELALGHGPGVGTSSTAYLLNTSVKPFLNGRVSAEVMLAATKGRPSGAGVLCRADHLHTFVVLQAVTDVEDPNLFRVGLAAFTEGVLQCSHVSDEAISLAPGFSQFTLQFFAQDVTGRVVSGESSHSISAKIPDVAFPGHCGVVRFFDCPATARRLIIESIDSRRRLGKMDDDSSFEFDAFICHAKKDQERVVQVVETMRQSGLKVWVDHEQVRWGDRIVKKIEDGLQRSRHIVVCVGEHLASSDWCQAEYAPILHREFGEGSDRRVIPLMLDASSTARHVPLLLSDKMQADFTDSDSFKAFVAFLRSGNAARDAS